LEVDLKEDLEVERELDSECWRSGITRVEIEGELNRKRRGRTRRERETERDKVACFLFNQQRRCCFPDQVALVRRKNNREESENLWREGAEMKRSKRRIARIAYNSVSSFSINA